MLLGSALLGGCYTSVLPPPNPQRPTTIYLCDYGIHSSLLLPISRGRYVEFLYGDWNWAALGHTSALDAIGALCFSQQSTLGRRFIEQSPDEKMPRPVDGPLRETCVVVNGDGCSDVVRNLMTRWEIHRITATAMRLDLSYVKDDDPYSWTHDCNTLTADCLREMGCRVDGFPIWSNFKVADPAR